MKLAAWFPLSLGRLMDRMTQRYIKSEERDIAKQD